MQIDNDGVTLHIAEDGDPDAPPLLLLHGITSFGGTWNWIVPELAERYRVLRLDFRGHGDSDRVPGGYTSSGYASDAIAACEYIGQPCIVMGHSLGGVTAAVVMQRRPELIRAAILEDPPLGIPEGQRLDLGEGHALFDAFHMMRQSIPGLQVAGMTANDVASFLAAVPTAAGGTMGETLEADGLLSMAASLLAVDASVLDPVLEGTIDMILDPDRGFDPPTLLVTADPAKPDAIADPDMARRLASISTATEVVTVAGAGHLIHDEIESRPTFRALVMEFLDRVSADTA
ncbi:MAG TPA: alpha/beta hydrolase [Ilumatobacteraceae bacterium]|nr:alpha/beta hydrolase [Ilumatobacteraceae bacterium]